ncbi:MAG: endonuclease III [candidate division WOR-3 bacterium]
MTQDIKFLMDLLQILERDERLLKAPVKVLKKKTSDPFRILVGSVISTRTKDEVTAQAVERLFKRISGPEDLLKMSDEEISKIIYPCGFYRNKSKILKKLAEALVSHYGGKVPDNREDLLRLPGVGRKVANIVLSRAYGKKAIAVDTHVHRISNRLGIVSTETPEETEKALENIVPDEWHSKFNELLVAFGQTICRPVRPRCDECPIGEFCPKRGVKFGKKWIE